MKTVYLVRHAESEGNIGPLQQGPDSPLSKTGLEQAEFVAKRFKTISIDRILSSPQTRAKQTAEAIGKSMNIPIEFSDLLIERKIPSALIGKPKDTPEFKTAFSEMIRHFHEADYRHSDEENAQDLKTRVLELFEYIESLPEEKILLVTHGVLLRMFVACAVMGKDITLEEYFRFYIGTQMRNTGITICKQDQFEDNPIHWKMVTWNDHAHLGEVK